MYDSSLYIRYFFLSNTARWQNISGYHIILQSI